MIQKKYGYILFGNRLQYRKCPVYFDAESQKLIELNDIVRFPEVSKIMPNFMCTEDYDENGCECVDTTMIVRKDLNPGHVGRSHEWNGQMPKPVVGDKFNYIPIGETSGYSSKLIQ